MFVSHKFKVFVCNNYRREIKLWTLEFPQKYPSSDSIKFQCRNFLLRIKVNGLLFPSRFLELKTVQEPNKLAEKLYIPYLFNNNNNNNNNSLQI